MSNQDDLLYALDRLALGFESEDPKVCYEAKRVAVQNFKQIASDLTDRAE